MEFVDPDSSRILLMYAENSPGTFNTVRQNSSWVGTVSKRVKDRARRYSERYN